MEVYSATTSRLRSDSGLSSCSNDTLSSKDLPSAKAQLAEKIKQTEQMAEKIKATQERCLKTYEEMNKKIDDAIERIHSQVEGKKREFQIQLEKYVRGEISSWDRQLEICREAEDWLRKAKFSENIQDTCDSYARRIGFINQPGISLGSLESRSEGVSLTKIILAKGVKKAKPKFSIGKGGKLAGELSRPWGVCTDATGRILVADRGNNRIQVFNERGRFLHQFGRIGKNPGEFNKPVGVTVDKNCRIIVTDKDNHRVQVFTFTGRFMFMFGQRGSKPGQFQFPWDVDSNSEGDIAVSDTKNHRVQLFSKNGWFVADFTFENQYVFPLGVAFKPDDSLLVTDVKSGAIFKIDEKFSTCTKLQDHMGYCTPEGVACSRSGKYAVTDSQNKRILVFEDEEKPERVFEVSGKNPGELAYPQGICFSPSGAIIMTDFGNNKIHVF